MRNTLDLVIDGKLLFEVISLASFDANPHCAVISIDSPHVAPKHVGLHPEVVASKMMTTKDGNAKGNKCSELNKSKLTHLCLSAMNW